MSARIMVDLDHLRPVTSDNVWHRVEHLTRMPKPGQNIQFLCGRVDTVEITENDEHATPTTCWSCDLVYSRAVGAVILPDHPGLHINRRQWPTPYPREES
jgi:hypothetical protein